MVKHTILDGGKIPNIYHFYEYLNRKSMLVNNNISERINYCCHHSSKDVIYTIWLRTKIGTKSK